MKYYIVQTRNGVTEFTTDQKTVRINSGHNHYTTVYTSDRTAWNAIGPGETTPTICQTIYFKPKKITIDIANNTTTTSGGWQNSTICTKVRRREASQIKLSAKSKVLVNGVSNPTETQVSTNAHTFKFSFNITTPNDRKLKTTYTIQRIIFESDEQENWSNAETVKGPREITAPNTSAITNSFTLNPESGKTYKVCERIRLEPDKYQIEYNANNTEEGVYALASHGNYAKRCTKVGWPGQKVRDDGVITVHSSSKGKINADYHSGTDSYIMKGEKATITYTHTLWRDAEKHKNGNKADVKSPKEDVTVSYRLDVSENSYSVRNFSIKNNPDNLELPTVTIPTNSKENPKIIESNKNSIFTNANITATAEKVGKIYSYCQSINYFSSKHTLRGKYLEVDGEIYDPKMIAALPPEARPATVGQSKPGCVNVLRPYNFNVNKITIENSPSGAIVSVG